MRKRVLVADDDAAILEALTLMLEDAGYKVETTTDGYTVQQLQDNFPDLILLDLWMSGIHGRDICRHLKNQEHTKKIPIIIISANKDTEEIAKKAGADDFILKPFDMNDLLIKIRSFIGPSD